MSRLMRMRQLTPQISCWPSLGMAIRDREGLPLVPKAQRGLRIWQWARARGCDCVQVESDAKEVVMRLCSRVRDRSDLDLIILDIDTLVCDFHVSVNFAPPSYNSLATHYTSFIVTEEIWDSLFLEEFSRLVILK